MLGNVSVKLDLFHAVQRITRTLYRRHVSAYQCTEDLRLVFREDGDSERKRSLPTPDSERMLLKLERFVEKWKDVKDSSGRSNFHN